MIDAKLALTAEDVIRSLELAPLPREGGYYRETHRASETIDPAALPARYRGSRPVSTSIFYLLTPDSFSALHRLPSDEVFHFYLGDPVEMLHLLPDGTIRRPILGPDLIAGHSPQIVVTHGTWQGCRLVPGGAWALLGTTVAPGFDFGDYEAGEREALVREYPTAAESIDGLLRA